jgi:hypothetical protein
MTNTDARVRSNLVRLSLQYYVAGRFAALNRLHDVAPVVLHHALEYILKAALGRTHTLAQLKRKPFVHDLESLWQAAVQEISTLKTPVRDRTIADLNKFEDLRYPDKLITQGGLVTIGIRSGQDPVVSGSQRSSGPNYRFNLEEADELWAAVFQKVANAPAFLQQLPPAARTALDAENHHSIASQ